MTSIVAGHSRVALLACVAFAVSQSQVSVAQDRPADSSAAISEARLLIAQGQPRAAIE